MKFFIASPWQNKEVVKSLTIALDGRGHSVHSFLDNGANAVGAAPSIEEAEEHLINSIATWNNDPAIAEIFKSDMQALRESDMIIVLEPSGRSSLVEAGIAYGMGKKVVRVGRVEHPEIVAFSICSAFYGSVEGFLSSLEGLAV